MATIKPKRGTGYPTNLATDELAVDSTNRVIYLGSAGGTGITIGSHISNYVSQVNILSGGGSSAITGAFGLSAGNNITFSVSGQTLTIASAGGAGSSPAGANGYVQYYKDGAFAGDANFQFNETTDVLTVRGLSAAGATFTGVVTFQANISAPNIVTSVNGSTGAITNIAVTNASNSFTAQQIITTGGLSASASDTTLNITATSVSGIGLVIANSLNTASSGAKTGRIRLGRSSTNSDNTTIDSNTGRFSIINGLLSGTTMMTMDLTGCTVGGQFKIGIRSGKTPAGNDRGSLVFDVYDFNTVLYTSTVVPNTTVDENTTHTLPSVSGTLLNDKTPYVSGICGATGAVILAAGSNMTLTRSGNTFTFASTASGGGSGVSGGTGIGVVLSGSTYTVSLDFGSIPAATAVTGDLLIFGDVSDSDRPKDATIGSVLDLITGDISVNSDGVATILNGVTGIVAGGGISVSSQTGNVTVTNTGVNTYDGLTGEVVTPPLLLYRIGII